MKKLSMLIVLLAFAIAVFADDPAPTPKFNLTGELDVGGSWEMASNITTDRPTELKLAPTLIDGNVAIYSRLLLLPPTYDYLNGTTAPFPVSLDYAYGQYTVYGSLFEHFMTAKFSLGSFADTSDYVLAYNSNGFTNTLQGNPIGGYIEGLVGGQVAFNPIPNLTLAVFVPWDNMGGATPAVDSFGRTDGIISYTMPKAFKINVGYGNSYNGDISGTLLQQPLGTNLLYANVALLAVENLALGAEYGNYYDVVNSKQVENYLSGTISYTFPDEKTGNSLAFSDDLFYFVPESGERVVQEYFTAAYTFSQIFSAADLILDLDVNYANNYPGTDSSTAGSVTATDRNLTINPWIKLSFGEKNDILALGYAYNYNIDSSAKAYSKLTLMGTIYF